MTLRSQSLLPSSDVIPHPRITGNDLPDDVWRLIANYVLSSLSGGQYLRYISINRTFFNFVLSVKYGEIRWFRLDGNFVRVLGRLQEPLIARYVQKLSIRAWFIDFLFKREELFLDASKGKEWKKTVISSPSRFAQGLIRRRSEVREGSGVTFEKSFAAGKLVQASSSQAIVRMLVQAVSGMKNVTEFNFEWRDLPLNKHTSVFLTSARSAFDKSLQKLTLRAQIIKFKELLAISNFDNIDELDFHFDYRPLSTTTVSSTKGSGKSLRSGNKHITSKDPDIGDLHNTVVPFIHHRRSQLRTLSISSSAVIDLSQFFNALPPLSNLRRFRVCISFKKESLSDPTGLLSILQNGRYTLLHVSFEAEWPESGSDVAFSRTDALQRKLADWTPINNQLIRLRECLCGLESLRIPFVSLSETMPLVKRSCDTLRSLCLADHFLSMDELNILAGMFAHRSFELKHLHIEVIHLNFEVVKLLANRFPGLDSLVLGYQSCDFPVLDTGIENTDIPDWKLLGLQVYQERMQFEYDDFGSFHHTGVHAVMEDNIELRIAYWVPSLRSTQARFRYAF